MSQRKKLPSLLVLAGLAAAAPAFGQSGTFTFVTGEVNVQRRDGQRVPVTRGTPVNAGDAIVTGARGMAQLTMVDQAKLSLRPNSQFQIEQYADRPDSDQGALLNLVRGTLRTFTGLIAARNREHFVMKTKIATVGIRGSGNVLFAGTAADCDPAKVDASGAGCDITVNHTIEGSHAVTFGDFSGTGLPPQQGGAQSLVTGPGQTVLVTGRGDVKYIPTPQFIAESATNPTGASKSTGGGEGEGGETRNFGPGDASGSSTRQGTVAANLVGNNGLGFTLTDASGNLAGGEPLGLQDVVLAFGSTFAGQALGRDVTYDSGNLRSYRMYAGLGVALEPAFDGGAVGDVQSYASGGVSFRLGRWDNVRFSLLGPGTGGLAAGGAHWILSGSGFPAYLADVLTGTAVYLPVVHTAPTNQLNTAGTITGARLDVNFSNRTLTANLGVNMPPAGGNSGGSWQLTAPDVPITFGSFFASTSDRLRITNGAGLNSLTSGSIYGGLEGSFVGSGLQGAVLGYSITDQSPSSPGNSNTVNGVVGFQGPPQDMGTPYRDGVVSDPMGVLGSALVRNFVTANRADEVTVDAQGRVSAFAAPYRTYGGHQSYTLGSSSVAQYGLDAETGLVWGRWAGGAAVVNGGAQQSLPLESNSLHFVFSGVQNGPVALPLTGTATYALAGHTSPTDALGHVGTLNSATLAADFSRRTVDLGLNLTVADQTISASASNVPIYRDQYFSAFRGVAPAGFPVQQLLNISCHPTCPNPVGSVDGFFAGRSGQGAGMMYNLNGATGAAAFRRGGG
jgi:hypothetical protein